MKHLRLAGTAVVVALVVLGIWVASSKVRTGDVENASETPNTAYDYDARDVVVQQMGPDGKLQYELEAKQITQLPRNGQISAQSLVMHHDPADAPPDGTNRWTMTADRADLPEAGTAITLQGNVHAEGKPPRSRATVTVATEQLTYNLDTQDLFTGKPANVTWGDSKLRCGDLRMNMKGGTLDLDGCNANF